MTLAPAPDTFPRFVPLEGARNFRDFGGYPTASGCRVRRGMLYRSNRLSRLTPGDMAHLDALGITNVFDLRARHEREADPTNWLCESRTVHTFRPGHKRRLVDMALDYPATPEGAAALMHDFYAELPATMGRAFAEILNRLAQGSVPAVIHCSAGKDRTGIACALVLGALGVERATIVADYALTARQRDNEADMARSVVRQEAGRDAAEEFRRRYPPEAIAVMREARPDFIIAALDAIDRKHGALEAYLDAIGVNARARALLARRLLEQEGPQE